MDSIANIGQLKEFLSVYNTLTERCFQACVREFNQHSLNNDEQECTQQCIDKQMRVNRRFMVAFAELAPQMMNRQQEEQMKKQEALIASMAQQQEVQATQQSTPAESTAPTENMKSTKQVDRVPATNLRPDGREPSEFRSTSFKLNVMKHADGSCLYEQGSAKVLCSVFGPLQRFKMRKLDDAAVLRCHMYRSRFSGTDRQKRKARADRETHLLLEQVLSELIILDNYPRTRIDIVFRILQSDGNNVAVCLNAANFALIDASINMRGILTVANCTHINEEVVVDVCDQDEPDTNGTVTIGSVGGKAEASFIDLRGCFARETFKEIMREALKTCEQLHSKFTQMISEEIKQIHKDKQEKGDSLDELDLEKLKIYEPGAEQPVRNKGLEEYDLAFEQLISDSEDEKMDEE
ncbi:hypothetical protein M3Y97_00304800 [Aphelenchoides bicaudatus]|nr:hypothetical protein M3Y97_00304800 [Aphelenchoides bicaudatus]